MKLRKHLDFKIVFGALYFLSFAVYLVIGLQPVEAVRYNTSGFLSIPSINLSSDVTTLKMENHKLETPDTIVGSFSMDNNKTLLIGHSSTVFDDLINVGLGDEIIYNGMYYEINDMKILEKSEVDMNEVLSDSDVSTIEIMTCTGEDLGDGDYTHRFILTAVIK